MPAIVQPDMLRRYVRLNLALALLLLSQASLGILRIQIVPLGFNVDEIIHFAHAKLVAAACLRDSVGLSWSLHRDDSERRNNPPWGEDVTAWIAFNEGELRKINPDNPQSAPCELLLDRRRVTNSAYYVWSGLPMALANNLSDRATINLGRIATMILGLATSVLSYHTVRRLLPRRTALPIGVASLMALNQHLADITTGINSDAGAIFAITLLFYTLAITRGNTMTAGRWVSILATLLLCLFVKSTAWISLPIVILWLWIRLPKTGRQWASISAVIAIIALIRVYAPVSWDVPAHWFMQDIGEKVHFIPAKVQLTDAKIGANTLLVDTEHSQHGLVQYLPEATVAALRGQTITVGGWVHLPSGGEIEFPNVTTSSGSKTYMTTGRGNWYFQAMVMEIPSDATYLAVVLPAAMGVDGPTLYDGVVLARGSYSTKSPPSFYSRDASEGIWEGGDGFTNLIRNGSAESMWPRVGIKNLFGLSTNRSLWSLMSWQRTSRVWLRELPSWLFTMHWSGFGGTQPGLSRWQLWPLLCLTVLAAFGSLQGLFKLGLPGRPRVGFNPYVLRTSWLLVSSATLIWLMVVLRADIFPHRSLMFTFAGTRYGLPAMLPGSILFTLGWMQLLPSHYHRTAVAGLTVILFLVNIHILLNVQIPVYECPLTPANLCLNTIR